MRGLKSILLLVFLPCALFTNHCDKSPTSTLDTLVILDTILIHDTTVIIHDTTVTIYDTITVQPALDKQEWLFFPGFGGGGVSSTQTEDLLVSNRVTVSEFNKNDFVSIDSIFLIANLETDDTSAFCIVSLWNLTDTTQIPGSEIMSNSKNYAWCRSGNIAAALPDHRITLGLHIRSSLSGKGVSIAGAAILLKRK